MKISFNPLELALDLHPLELHSEVESVALNQSLAEFLD
jgi:hypothetical protein